MHNLCEGRWYREGNYGGAHEQYAVFSDYVEQPYLATVPNNWSGGKK